jgi:nucleoside-diphosphate-sugar epimerase
MIGLSFVNNRQNIWLGAVRVRVLITGAGGFFGLALVRAFAHGGDSVVAVDRTPPDEIDLRPDTPRDNLQSLTCDVSRRDSVLSLDIGSVDAIVHAAALTPTSEQERTDPDSILDVNLGGTINVLSLARRLPECRRFVLISSSAVFSPQLPGVLHEADADGGVSMYGAAKLAAERVALRYGATAGFGVAAVRPTSLYGPGERPRPSRPHVTQIWQLVHAARRGTPVCITGETARNDWLYVDDAAEAVHSLVHTEDASGVFNLSSGESRRFGEVVEMLSSHLPILIDPASSDQVDGGIDRPGVVANDRIRDAIDWTPRRLSEGIAAFVRDEAESTSHVVTTGGR